MNTEIYCNKYGKYVLNITSENPSSKNPFDEIINIKEEYVFLDKNIKVHNICCFNGVTIFNIYIDEYTFRLLLRTKNIHTESTPDKVLDMIKIDGRIHIGYSTEHADLENMSFLKIETKSDPENDTWTTKYKKIIDSHIADKIVSSLSEGVTIDKICDIVRCK